MLSPVLKIFDKHSETRSYRDAQPLIHDLSQSISKGNQSYASPGGWRPLRAANVQALSVSVENQLRRLGVDKRKLRVNGGGNSLSIEVDEMTIDQLNEIVFQLEGFYPAVEFQKFVVRVHPKEKELITFNGNLTFNAQAARQRAGSPGRRIPPPEAKPIRKAAPTPTPPPRPSPRPSRIRNNRKAVPSNPTAPRFRGAPPPRTAPTPPPPRANALDGPSGERGADYEGPDDYDEYGAPDIEDYPADLPPPPVFEEDDDF